MYSVQTISDMDVNLNDLRPAALVYIFHNTTLHRLDSLQVQLRSECFLWSPC